MSPYCPDMIGLAIKPDIMFYRADSLPQKTACLPAAEIIGEAKFEANEDPFLGTESIVDEPVFAEFFVDPVKFSQNMGQLASYAIAHLGSRFRTHACKVDRAGALVTEPIPLIDSCLAEFFWRYNHASQENRGFDRTVKPFFGTAELTKEFLFDRLSLHEDGQTSSADFDFYEVYMPMSGNQPTDLEMSSLPWRTTRTFKAWSIATNEVVLLKDTWRFYSPSQKPDHEIYAKEPWARVLDGVSTIRVLQHYRLVLREGTWAFQAIELQEQQVEHKRYHDLESFYHVLMWLSLKHARHTLSPNALFKMMHSLYESWIESPTGERSPPLLRWMQMRSRAIVTRTDFQNPPLRKLLVQLGNAFYNIYEDLDGLAAHGKIFKYVAEDCKRKEASLIADAEPTWAEECFLEAVYSQGWGETSNVWHEMTPKMEYEGDRFRGMYSSDACMHYPVHPRAYDEA
ncbi:hypothetical protein CPB84DRAFT_1775732 [Gymnopilus junonius]|uniref:Fungal-type protein kinase domain-containing protein n=1 Tax=Gymnopilus junonius TaxID=109634 RepID=A0A9P5NRI7_GYMJU|nr:hypothetical protein CPB84DRAFT_1775732 [Gymnopilus junonius]